MGTGNEPAVGVPYGFPQPPTGYGPGPEAQYVAQDGGYPPQGAGGYYPQQGYPPQNFAGQNPAFVPQGAGFRPPGSPGPRFPPPGSPGPAVAPDPYRVPDMVVMTATPLELGHIPPDAVYTHVPGLRLGNTFYGDTSAPFECPHCGKPGLTTVRSERSVAAYVACMMAACIGVCFLFPGLDCLWHKYHYCPNCDQKVGDLIKTDPCLVMDPTQWTRPSFGIPLRPFQP